MTGRGKQLYTTVAGQIDELVALLSRVDEATLRRPCLGREKLGDGSVAASAQHTADNYRRIAAFVQTSDCLSHARETGRHGAHRIPTLRRLGHGPADHVENRPDMGTVFKQLAASRDALGQITELTDGQLDTIPPKDTFRFCDGQRTLEQVLASLLKHQSHQIEALAAALT